MKLEHFYPVVLAGGSGTRFWPRSRRHRAKQVLALDGRDTMIQQTVARLRPLAPAGRFWIITSRPLRKVIVAQLPKLDRSRIIAEPAARNTAPAIGLAAFLLARHDRNAVLGMFPADHVIAHPERFRRTIARAVAVARAGPNMVVLGIQPARPETGYGYIETGDRAKPGLFRVKRFIEKPNLQKAEQFVAAGNYFWNSGMFLWKATTLASALREHLSESAPLLEEIALAHGTPRFERTFRRLYPRCENISVDYAVLEPRSAKGEHHSNLFCIPADFGWNDLGSWTALHAHHAARNREGNVVEGAGSFALDAEGNYVYAPGKFVATIGVRDVVVVETEDALLITTRDRAQDVGKVVKHLAEKKLDKLL